MFLVEYVPIKYQTLGLSLKYQEGKKEGKKPR